MNVSDYNIKERILLAAILKEFWEYFSNSILINDPIIKLSVSKELTVIKNGVYLETKTLCLEDKIVNAAVISNHLWKQMDSKKKSYFIEIIKIIFIESFTDGLVKSVSTLIWQGVLNRLNE